MKTYKTANLVGELFAPVKRLAARHVSENGESIVW